MIMERSVGPGGEAGKLDVGTGTPGGMTNGVVGRPYISVYLK